MHDVDFLQAAVTTLFPFRKQLCVAGHLKVHVEITSEHFMNEKSVDWQVVVVFVSC